MAEGKKSKSASAEELLGSIIADSPELWQLADQFVHGLPIQAKLLQEALWNSALEQSRRCATHLKAARASSRQRILQAADVSDAAEEMVISDLTARMDDLTLTILKIQVRLQKHET